MRNRALSVMILKIDRYDNFVHSYGSYTTDKIFQAVANAVQIQLRGMDMAVKYDEGCIALLLIGTVIEAKGYKNMTKYAPMSRPSYYIMTLPS